MMSDRILDAIKNRRSMRKYTSDPVPTEDIETILTAGMMAPSAMNARPWEFVVVQNDDIKQAIAAKHPFAKFIPQAPVVIVVCGMPEKERAPGLWPSDCAAATENILIQAQSMGYGTCWCGIHPYEKRGKDLMPIIDVSSTPFCLIALGVPNDTPRMRGFYEPEKVHYLK